MADVQMDDERDPIKASYDIYIKPCISEGRQIYVLQFPNRDANQRYSRDNESQPLKMRIKPEAGMVELDVPMDAWNNYDRGKGLKWGDAVKKSNVIQGGGSHGLPGGFGIGGGGGGGRGRNKATKPEDEDMMQQRILADYANAVQRNHVLTKQTLGGQAVPIESTTPQYMIGTFRQNQLHLTPVDKIVQMRPQFHHIDAEAELAKAAKSREGPVVRTQEARAVHMTVKSNIDGEEDATDSMGKRITAAQSEAWKSHAYIDEDEYEAWEEFKESLFVGTEKFRDHEEVLKSLPKLKSSLDNAEYLDTISVRKNTKVTKKKIKKEKVDVKGKGVAVEGAKDVPPPGEDTYSDLEDRDPDPTLLPNKNPGSSPQMDVDGGEA